MVVSSVTTAQSTSEGKVTNEMLPMLLCSPTSLDISHYPATPQRHFYTGSGRVDDAQGTHPEDTHWKGTHVAHHEITHSHVRLKAFQTSEAPRVTEGHSESLRRVRKNASSCSAVPLLSRNSINNLPSYNNFNKASYFCLSTYQFSENYTLGQMHVQWRKQDAKPEVLNPTGPLGVETNA